MHAHGILRYFADVLTHHPHTRAGAAFMNTAKTMSARVDERIVGETDAQVQLLDDVRDKARVQ